MKVATAELEGMTPYSQSRYYADEFPKQEKESDADYRNRTWKAALHTDESGVVFIPAMALKNCLQDAAKYLSIGIPGKGKATYTKHFEAGVMVLEDVSLGIHKDKIKPEYLFLPSDGKRGSGRRVPKIYPKIDKGWKATARFHVFDDTITKEVFEYVLKQAGQFICLGRWRVRNGGMYGMFQVKKIKWSEE